MGTDAQSYTMRAFQRSGPVTYTELADMRRRLWLLLILAGGRLPSHDPRIEAARIALSSLDKLNRTLRDLHGTGKRDLPF